MKTIYALGTPAYHEQDEMVFKYVVYDQEKVVSEKTVYHEYRKPSIVGLYTILLLLKEIPEYKTEEVTIIVNDGAILEQIKGTTTTKNTDILKVAKLCRNNLRSYSSTISIESVAGTYKGKLDWERKLDI